MTPRCDPWERQRSKWIRWRDRAESAEGRRCHLAGCVLMPARDPTAPHLDPATCQHHLPYHLCISELSWTCQDLLRAVTVHKPPPPDPGGVQVQDEKEV